jgi:hypothetical protein
MKWLSICFRNAQLVLTERKPIHSCIHLPQPKNNRIAYNAYGLYTVDLHVQDNYL